IAGITPVRMPAVLEPDLDTSAQSAAPSRWRSRDQAGGTARIAVPARDVVRTPRTTGCQQERADGGSQSQRISYCHCQSVYRRNFSRTIEFIVKTLGIKRATGHMKDNGPYERHRRDLNSL